MNDARYSELIAKYLSGEVSPDEKKELMSWVEQSDANRVFFEETIQLWSISDNYSDAFEADITEAWTVLEQKLDAQKRSLTSGESSKQTQIMPLWQKVVSIAAVGLAALVAAYWLFQQPFSPESDLQILQTGLGEQQEVLLPDSSRVFLNENTVLSYSTAFAERQVQLAGEAFFEVKRLKERPFEVISPSTKTVVLGTSFNVRAYPEEEQIEVTVETGKVLLAEQTEAEESKVLLNAGTSGIYHKTSKELVKTETKLDNAIAWKTKKLNFVEASMREVIADLERYFDIDIQTPNESLLNCPYTGDFPNPELENVLTAIGFAIDAELQQKDSMYILQGQGCE